VAPILRQAQLGFGILAVALVVTGRIVAVSLSVKTAGQKSHNSRASDEEFCCSRVSLIH
jgi:hypothetical protein